MDLVEELSLSEDHFNMIKPKLPKAALFLRLSRIAADGIKEVRILKCLEQEHLCPLVMSGLRVRLSLLPSEVLLNRQRHECDEDRNNCNDLKTTIEPGGSYLRLSIPKGASVTNQYSIKIMEVL